MKTRLKLKRLERNGTTNSINELRVRVKKSTLNIRIPVNDQPNKNI